MFHFLQKLVPVSVSAETIKASYLVAADDQSNRTGFSSRRRLPELASDSTKTAMWKRGVAWGVSDREFDDDRDFRLTEVLP